ncbi:hypothetical protein [Chrysiogenes arsenatis]|uniref:hypothetical protein n=1 Tax=Chrysiogenes arsenatis TaxID=309797 RepID=UPI0003F736EA|nr:hypothetical protein [Chrysiogenes arsenatis]
MRLLWQAFDWSVLKTTVLTTVIVSVSAIMVFGSILTRYQSAQKHLQDVQRERHQVERALAQQAQQHREQEQYGAIFTALPHVMDNGVPRHLDLLDQLEDIAETVTIPYLTVRMASLQPFYDPRWNEATVAVETVHLDMQLRHEVDLFRLIEALHVHHIQGDLHWPHCLLQRTSVTDALVLATCELSLYSVSPVTPAKGER